MSRVIPRKTLDKLRELRDFMEAGSWIGKWYFHMMVFFKTQGIGGPCGCLAGFAEHSGIVKTHLPYPVYWYGMGLNEDEADFLFHEQWAIYDNTAEGAIGRLDAILSGLRF